MNKKIVVAILLLCAALSMGCIDQTVDTPVNVFVEEPEKEQITSILEETTLEPAKLVIKSIKVEDEGIVTKIKNEGELPAEDIYFAIIGIDYHPSYDENLKWNHNISDTECLNLINGVIRNNNFKLNTSDYGRYLTKKPQNSNDYINVSGEPLNLVPNVYRDYLDIIEPGETIESNMMLYWDHVRYIKVIYDGDYNIYEYKLYDDYDTRAGILKSIIC